MSSLGTVIRFEFARTVTKRSFWVRALSIPILVGGLLVLSIFSSKAASNEAKSQAKSGGFTIAVRDDSRLVNPAVIKAAGAKIAPDRDTGIAWAQSGNIDAFFYYPSEPSKMPVEVYAKDVGLVDSGKYETVASQLLHASLIQSVGNKERAALLEQPPQTKLVTYKDGQETKGFGRVIVPGLFLVLFYAVIVLLGNQMLTSTTEEKENRVIEMILTSVSARTVIVGKIWALIALGGIQIAAILIPVLVGYFRFRSQLHIQQIDLNTISFAPWPIIAGAAIFVGGFIMFTAMLVAIGSAVPTAKEASGFFGVAIILMVLPAYALGLIISSPDQLIVKVMTFFPPTAPITLMLRNAVGNLTTRDTIIGLVILFVSGIALMGLAIRIFRFGSLEYARKLSLREIFTRQT
jgi:ABC-2 type transport system permease protein